MKQHTNRFANGQLGGKITQALEQRRRNFLAASNQEQTFAGFQVLAEDHADADVLDGKLEYQARVLRISL